MLHFHPNARTTPATRAEIARSSEPSGTVAQCYGISAETVRKWRKRGAADCFDRPARPRRLPWKATEEERAIVCALRRATNFPLDDLTFVVCHFPPHLNRDSIWRILKAEGLNCRTKLATDRLAKGQGTFHDYDLGFVHIDIKHLASLGFCQGAQKPWRATPPHKAPHAANERHGRALQRPHRLRGAGHQHLLAPCPGTTAAWLQPGLQRSAPARAGRQNAQPSRRRAPQSRPQARQPCTARPRGSLRCDQGTPHRRNRQEGLTTRQRASWCSMCLAPSPTSSVASLPSALVTASRRHGLKAGSPAARRSIRRSCRQH